jgi:nitrate/nitrite transporter NarK
MQEWLYPMGVVLLGYTVLGLTGFGSALVVVPLLAWNWPLPAVVALTLLMDVPASAFHSGLNWRQVQWRELRRLLPGMVVGTLLGLWLMQHMNSRWPLLVLGVYVAGVGLNALRVRGAHLQPPAPVWVHAVGGAVGLAAFTCWELRVPAPVFEVRLFRANRVFACSCLAALIHYSATFGVTFLMSLYLQYIQGLTPQKAGTILMVQPLVMAFFSPLAGRWSDRVEPRVIASAGMAITAASLLQLSMVGPQTGLPTVVTGLMVLGFGFALFSSPNMNAIMGSVEKRFFGIASGSVGTMRLMGQMLSMGIATVVLTLMLGRVPMTPAAYPLFMKSLQVTLGIFSGLCLAGVLLSLVRGRLHAAR